MLPKMKMLREEGRQMKNVIAFAAVITVVMAIVLIAFTSSASADAVERTYDRVGGVLTYEGGLPRDANHDSRSISVYLGEEIIFENDATGKRVDVIVTGPYDGEGDKRSGCMDYSVKAGKSWDSSGMKKGYFYSVVEKNDTDVGCWFGTEGQSFDLELKDDKDKVQEKESFDLSLKSNNKKDGVMKLTIDDSEGYSIMNAKAQDIYEVLVNYTGRFFDSDPIDMDNEPVCGIKYDADGHLIFNTSQLDMEDGKFNIILEDYATEEMDNVNIKVEMIYLDVACDEEVLKGNDIVIIIGSSFYDKQVHVTVGTFYNESPTFDRQGKKKVRISTDDIDYGRYKVTVAYGDTSEIKYVVVKECETSIEMPGDAIVGDIVHIVGTSEYGDFVVFVIDDVFEGKATITDDKFEWDWDTSGELDGYRRIEVFTLCVLPPFSIGDYVSDDWQREAGVDASASIILSIPSFSMTVPESIAMDDPIVINGTVTGADHVYIIVFNYKGEVMFPPGVPGTEVPATSTSVDEGEWSETIAKLDNGDHVVFALSEGDDRVTEAISDGNWVIGGECKTMEQRVAIFEDEVTTAGSDDLYELAYFYVTMPKVRLTVPETVKIGDAISVQVETNIEEDVVAFVSLLSSADIIDEVTVEVQNGRGNASFNTNGLHPGKYSVEGSIKGEAYDEVGVILVEAEEVERGENEEVEESISQNESVPETTVEAIESEEVEELISQNESVTESETTVEATESVGERELNERTEVQEMPIIAWDLLIAVIVAISISIVVRRRR